MNKKVLFVATTAKGHINVFHIPYIKMLKKRGLEVHAVTNGDARIPYVDKQFSIDIERQPFNIRNLKALFQICSIMNSERYSMITCHTPMGGALARIAAIITRTGNVIYTAHGFHFYNGASIKNNIIYKSMEKLLARWTDVLIIINDEDYQQALKFKLKKNGKVLFIPGIGVDTLKIQHLNIDLNKKRNELKVTEGYKVILIVGEFIERKNYETAIKSFAKLKNKDTLLLICGRGRLENKLKLMAENLGVKESVIFAGFRTDIAEVVKIADIFLFTSFQEGLPISVIEAMAAGLPVVCSDVRGNRDLIDDRKGGFIVAPNDVKGFTDALDEILSNDELKLTMGNYNISASNKYDIRNVKKIMSSVFDELLSKTDYRKNKYKNKKPD